MYPATPSHVQTWWHEGKLFINVIGQFEGPGSSLNVLHETAPVPTFNLMIGYDGSPATGGTYPYNETVWFEGPYVEHIRIVDANGSHMITVPVKN